MSEMVWRIESWTYKRSLQLRSYLDEISEESSEMTVKANLWSINEYDKA